MFLRNLGENTGQKYSTYNSKIKIIVTVDAMSYRIVSVIILKNGCNLISINAYHLHG